MGGIIFAIFVCALFHVICDPPVWATVGLFIVIVVQYSIAYTISDSIGELINAK